MADCYYHGYVSGPSCPKCDREDRAGLKQGTLDADTDSQIRPNEHSLQTQNEILGKSGKKSLAQHEV